MHLGENKGQAYSQQYDKPDKLQAQLTLWVCMCERERVTARKVDR